MNKLDFVQNQFPSLAAKLSPAQTGSWGKMNALQMMEHMAESVSFATGKNNKPLHTPAEHVSKYKEFMLSDKPFKENTKNALMAEEPVPATRADMKEAIDSYNQEVAAFIKYFKENPGSTLTNSFFGNLNFDEWVHLLHKHATHHAKQFGLV
jgi:hypothetical protein